MPDFKRLITPFNKDALRKHWIISRRQIYNAIYIANNSNKWGLSFDACPLLIYRLHVNLRLRRSLQLSEISRGWRREVDFQVFDSIFGINRSDHAFFYHKIDWAYELTEPQATMTLAKLLNAGPVILRAERIYAFLTAMGVNVASLDDLYECEVIAERNKIDLQFIWLNPTGGKYVTVIEAKFDHDITEGQLDRYYTITNEKHGGSNFNFILLGLDELKFRNNIKNAQHKIWRFVSWNSLWRQFEIHRPEEDSANLSIFLNTLWNRIGGLKQRIKK